MAEEIVKTASVVRQLYYCLCNPMNSNYLPEETG